MGDDSGQIDSQTGKPNKSPCHSCNSVGWRQENVICSSCHGSGQVYYGSYSTCMSCAGVGSKFESVTCLNCKGSGWV